MKILIADKLSDVGINWLNQQEGVEVDIKPGLPPEELAEIIGSYDGIIIRSGAKITSEILSKPGNLKCIARAGVGVDNVDVPAATAKGVIVMNTPSGNTVSTAELAFALILALSRKISPANASLMAGKWDRKKFQGTQLAGKTLAVIGMGRIGQTVAARANAFDMKVIAYDPFFAGQPLPDVEMVKDLNDLCKAADYITIHTPKSAETTGMIGQEQFDIMKPSVRIINAARGGIIDSEKLLDALNNEKISGAAIDVYTSEPPESEAEKSLIAHPAVLAVPHLGASTEEAQEQVAIDAAKQLVEAVSGGEVRNALNAPGFDKALSPELRPYSELAIRMGTLLATITPGAITKAEIVFRGAIADMNVAPISTYLLVGLLRPHLEQPVNVINAPVIAKQRGIEVKRSTSDKVAEFANVMEITVTTDKLNRSATGTIFGKRFPRIIALDGYHLELKPEGDVVIILNDDQPGVLGRYGSIFGKSEVNIADLTFSRKTKSGLAVVGINLDEQPAPSTMEEVRNATGVKDAWYLQFPLLPAEESSSDEK